jgi:hypothetical protein
VPLRIVCAFVLLCILVAGLWPFHAPRNEVSWFSHGNGLFLGKRGSIVSAGTFKPAGSRPDSPCSVELLLEPERLERSGTVFAFYQPESRVVPFALRQFRDVLLVQLPDRDGRQDARNARVWVKQVFSRQEPVFVAVTSGPSGTRMYANGRLVGTFSSFRFSREDLTGQLIIGNSPASTRNWSGSLWGFAIYGRELSAGEISEEYAAEKEHTALAAKQGAAAFYPFDEGIGSIVHNQVDPATNLIIPERFFVLNKQFLERPWTEFHAGWNYWKDVGINIAGFIPLGFFFCAYFSSARGSKRAVVGTIALGFAISLTIEVLQAFLPTRDSGMTDLFTNTLGTALGATSFAWMVKHNLLARAGIPKFSWAAERREYPQ